MKILSFDEKLKIQIDLKFDIFQDLCYCFPQILIFLDLILMNLIEDFAENQN